uniref:Uncharacterized protein n=1 Tax=viral metagenome TaxID=1070528 RepID=A0A6C0I518_9ZZZZ
MDIFENYNKQDKYLILVRKLKEAFITFTDDMLEVFPKYNDLFMQRIIAHQLPDTSLYKILDNNMNIEKIFIQDDFYLKYQLKLLDNYHQYLNEEYNVCKLDVFSFNYLSNKYDIFEDNIDMIWKWLKVIALFIKNINSLSH